MLCDACGEEFAGFRHEELDAYMAGTAISTRQSQSSQARSIREKITARAKSSSAGLALSDVGRRKFVNDELLLCEAVILTAKSLTDRLVELRCVNRRVMKPLFELLTCWVSRRHAGKTGVVGRGSVFRPTEVLALVSLAALYVRSPMLPRDLCRMVVCGELPYPGFSEHELPEHVRESSVVAALFTPQAVPNAGEVVEAANKLALDQHAWAPIRRFFGDGLRKKAVATAMTGSRMSFPVGHLTLTLLRMSRLLGLPDEFGARVLRYIELRQIASKMSWTFGDIVEVSKGQDSRIDTVILEGLGPRKADIKKALPSSARCSTDLYGFPTDESLQIDFVNTMRLCYGASTQNRKRGGNKKLETEWENCKEAMESWLKRGNLEDLETVQWTAKSPAEISHTKGEDIRKYADMVDDLLTGMGETMPDLWGKYIAAFTELGEHAEQNDKEEANEDYRDIRACMYDENSIGSGTWSEPLEGREEMDIECGNDSATGMAPLVRPPLRELRDMPWGAAVVRRSERERRRKRDDLRKSPTNKDLKRSHPLTKDDEGVESEGIMKVEDADLEATTGNDVSLKPMSPTRRRMRFEKTSSGNAPASADEGLSPDNVPGGRSAWGAPPAGERSTGNVAGGDLRLDDQEAHTLRRATVKHTEDANEEPQPGSKETVGLSTPGIMRTKSAGRTGSRSSGAGDEKSAIDEEVCQYERIHDRDFLQEPAGIGLAWTIFRRFFAGSNVVTGSMESVEMAGITQDRLRRACDNSMRTVILYVLALQGKGTRPVVGGKAVL